MTLGSHSRTVERRFALSFAARSRDATRLACSRGSSFFMTLPMVWLPVAAPGATAEQRGRQQMKAPNFVFADLKAVWTVGFLGVLAGFGVQFAAYDRGRCQ